MSFRGLYQHQSRKRPIRLSNTGPAQSSTWVHCILLPTLLTKYDQLEWESVPLSPLEYISFWITVQLINLPDTSYPLGYKICAFFIIILLWNGSHT